MATIIQMLKGTAAEVAAKTYASGVLVWNETAKRWHGGDGVTAGGIAMARDDEKNDGALGYLTEVKTDDYAVVVGDIGKMLVANKGTAVTFTLGLANDLTSKFVAVFKNIGAGTLSIATTSSELIDGSASAFTVPTNASVIIKGNGSSFRSYLSNGDVTGAAINNAAAKTVLADSDKLGIIDSAASNVLKHVTFANLIASIFVTARKIANAYFLSSFRLWDASDDTKGLGFVLSSITTGTTRLLTMPDRDINLTKFPTDWTAYTPTFTGFGTVVTHSMFSRRVGDTLEIMGTFVCATSTAVEARMTLGTGLTSDATKVPSIRHCGAVAIGVAVAAQYYALIETSVGYITFSRGNVSSSPLTKADGNVIAASGNVISINAKIPISGW